MSPFQILPAYRASPRNNPGKIFFPNWWFLDCSFAIIGWYSTNEPNGIIGPLNGSPKRLSKGVFPSDKISSQINLTFHRICPPFFIQTWLQQYSRGAFFHSSHCSFSNPICFWSEWCRRTMIPAVPSRRFFFVIKSNFSYLSCRSFIKSPWSIVRRSLSFPLLRRPSTVVIQFWITCWREAFHELLMEVMIRGFK